MYSARRELQGRMIYTIEKTERRSAKAPALRKRFHTSKFDIRPARNAFKQVGGK